MVQSPSWEANWFAASQEISPHFTEPEDSLPHSQASATCLYPGPAQSSPYTHIPPPGRSVLILSTPLRLGRPSGLRPSGFPSKTLYIPLSSPIRATCPAHLILLDFNTRTILVKCVFWFSVQLFSETFLILRRIEWDIKKMYIGLHVTNPLFLSDFIETWISWTVSPLPPPNNTYQVSRKSL